METFERRVKLAELLLASIGVVGGLVGASLAYRDYQDKAQTEARNQAAYRDGLRRQDAESLQQATRDAMRSLHQLKATVCLEVCDASSKLFDATNLDALNESLRQFARLKHGKALALLDRDVIEAMLDVYGAALQVWPDDAKPLQGRELQHEILCKIGNKPFELAHRCRAMIAKDYDAQLAGVATGSAKAAIPSIQLLERGYAMNWTTQEHCPASEAAEANLALQQPALRSQR